MIDSTELRFAVRAVRAASRLVQDVQREMTSPAMAKEDRSPVTVGDFSAQALVARMLEEAFPSDRLVGEESALALRRTDQRELLAQVAQFVGRQCDGASPEAVCDWIDRGAGQPSGRFWTLDPIDGTKGFLRGGQYAVALALVEDGIVRLGVLGCPNLSTDAAPAIGGSGSLYFAAQGDGAWVAPMDSPDGTTSNERQIRVSDRREPAIARLLRSVEEGHTDGGKIAELVALLGIGAEPVKMDSQAKYAVLAAGGGEIVLRLLSPTRPNYREQIWDQAAGSIVVEEAGGRISDLAGLPFDFTCGRTLARNRGVAVSNGHLHEAVLDGLARIGAIDAGSPKE